MKLRNHLCLAVAAVMLAGAAVPSFTFAAPAAGDHPAGQQPARGPGMKQIQAIDDAAKADTVKLDDDQKSKVQSIIDDAMSQVKALHQDTKDAKAANGGDKNKDDKKDVREKVLELVTQTQDRVEAVLTDVQKTAFRDALKAERAKLKEARADKPAGEKPAGGKGNKKPA